MKKIFVMRKDEYFEYVQAANLGEAEYLCGKRFEKVMEIPLATFLKRQSFYQELMEKEVKKFRKKAL